MKRTRSDNIVVDSYSSLPLGSMSLPESDSEFFDDDSLETMAYVGTSQSRQGQDRMNKKLKQGARDDGHRRKTTKSDTRNGLQTMGNLFYEEDDIEQAIESQQDGPSSYPENATLSQSNGDSLAATFDDGIDQFSLLEERMNGNHSTQSLPSWSPARGSTPGRHGVKKITDEDRKRAKKMVAQERKYWERHFLQKKADPAVRDTYKTFSSLQALSQSHMMNFDTPEVVIVGMQSDGKSSFIEALMGFQFNAVDTQIGTRRPLLLQMINDGDYVHEPHCTFMKDDLSGWEEKNTPAKELEYEIRQRTDDRCGPTGVSSVPIIIRVQYAYCANLNIYDTPGFRKGKDDPLRSRIAKMNRQLLSDKNRLIVCLEQSTVEWCNTQIRPIIRSVDPKFERTIFVATKFGNRANQFKSDVEINGYLSTDGAIPDPERVFFMSLPSGVEARSLDDPREYQRAVLNTYLSDYETLCKIGFDVQRYRKQLGFMRLQQFLEQELFIRYQRSVKPMIGRIVSSIERRRTHISRLTEQIERMEQEDVERTINNMLYEYMRLMHAAMRGTNDFDTAANGMTLEEERTKSNAHSWPNFTLDIPILNEKYKLYGGAQLMRLLAEFEIVAHSQECPSITDDEVAVSIGLSSVHTRASPELGASDLAQKKCRAVLRPLIDVLIERYRFIMKHTIGIVTDHMVEQQQQQQQRQQTMHSQQGDLELRLTQEDSSNARQEKGQSRPSGGNDNTAPGRSENSTTSSENDRKPQFQGFFLELQRVSNKFIDNMLRDVRNLSADEFDTFTRIIDWDLVANCNYGQLSDYDLLEPTADDTKRRVAALIESPKMEESLAEMQLERGREMNEERCRRVKIMAAKLFAGVRLMFVKFMRAKFNALFIDPIFNNMDESLREHFRKLSSDQLKELAGLQIQKLKQERVMSERYIERAEVLKGQFEKLQEKIALAVATSAELQKQ